MFAAFSYTLLVCACVCLSDDVHKEYIYIFLLMQYIFLKLKAIFSQVTFHMVQARLREAASLEKHVLLKNLRDALESLRGRVVGRNKDDVEEAIAMVSSLLYSNINSVLKYQFGTSWLLLLEMPGQLSWS